MRAMQGGGLYHFYDGLWYDPVTIIRYSWNLKSFSNKYIFKYIQMSYSQQLTSYFSIYYLDKVTTLKNST